MDNAKLKGLWEAFDFAAKLTAHFKKTHGREPTEIEQKVAVSVWIEQNKGTHSANGAAKTPAPPCPQCGGKMFDNRGSKKNPKQPDFRCRDQNCTDESGYRTSVWGSGPPKAKKKQRTDDDYEDENEQRQTVPAKTPPDPFAPDFEELPF